MGGWVFTAIISGIGDAGKVAQSYRLEQENFIMVTLIFFQSAMLRSYRLPPQGLN